MTGLWVGGIDESSLLSEPKEQVLRIFLGLGAVTNPSIFLCCVEFGCVSLSDIVGCLLLKLFLSSISVGGSS